jgi:hypothetical protein
MYFIYITMTCGTFTSCTCPLPVLIPFPEAPPERHELCPVLQEPYPLFAGFPKMQTPLGILQLEGNFDSLVPFSPGPLLRRRATYFSTVVPLRWIWHGRYTPDAASVAAHWRNGVLPSSGERGAWQKGS